MGGSPIRWQLAQSDAGGSFRWGYAGDDVVAEWADILSIRATRDGELKSVRAFPGARKEIVEKTRFGVAAAFLRAQRNQHSLHASAVAVGNECALACIGASGLGKSTVADRMCRREDVLLVGDDATGIDLTPQGVVQVIPSESVVWLTTAGSSEKLPARRARAATHPVALGCIVSLAFDESARSLQLRELRGADAVAALLPATHAL